LENKSIENPQIIPPSPYPWYGSVPFEEEVNLIDYWRVIQKRKRFIIFFTCLCIFLTALISWMLPKKYKAEVSLMPIQSNSSGGSLAALASSLPMVGDLAGAGGMGKSGQLVNILKSRTVAERIVKHFELMHVFFGKSWDEKNKVWVPNWRGKIPVLEDAVNILKKKIIKIQDEKKTNLVRIEVVMKDSALATAVANRFIVELQDFITHNQLSVEKRNRIYVEEQLQKNKIELLEIGKKLNDFYGNNRISSAQPELDVNVGKITNPPLSFEEFRDELTTLSGKKEDLMQKLTEEEKQGIVQKVPSQVYLQFITLQRDLLMRINVMLTQQYEMAKIDEAKEDLAFQVIDKAVLPIRPYSPDIKLNIAVAFIGGLFLSVFIAFFREYLEKMKQQSSKS